MAKRSFALFKRIHNVLPGSNWIGYWIFKWKWFEIVASKDSVAYPNISITFHSDLFYFLRLHVELRYKE